MRVIELTQGKFTKVDDNDFDYLCMWKWHARKDRHGKFRAATKVGSKGVEISRIIMKPKQNEHVDHRNSDTLDNTRDNLRTCTNAENIRNSKPILMYGGKKCSSKYKGVSRHQKKWRSIITLDGKRINLGCFINEEYASIIYNAAAKKYFGEFAYKQ